MRKRILLVLIFIPLIAWGQSYSVEFSFTESFYNDSFDPYYLEIGNSNEGSYQVLVQSVTGDNITVNPPQTTVVGFRPNVLRTRDVGGVVDSETILYIPANGHCYNGVIPVMDSNGVILNVTIEIEPNLFLSRNPAPPANPSSCETVSLSTSGAYDANVYNWEYRANGGMWNPLPAYDGMNSINIGIDDIPGLNVNESLQIRIRYCISRSSNIQTFNFIKCSPDINNFTVNNTSCSYLNDGGFTVVFSRTLDPGETLLLNLFQGAPPGDAGAILVDALIIDDTDMPGNSYNWPSPLPANTDYYLRYQVDNDGSVYDHGPFNITTPTPVTFDAIWTDINCFGENTGSIDITAAGGTQSYQYRLNNGSWTNFSNQFTHTISGLSAGNYQVRVRDTNGCTEQQTP